MEITNFYGSTRKLHKIDFFFFYLSHSDPVVEIRNKFDVEPEMSKCGERAISNVIRQKNKILIKSKSEHRKIFPQLVFHTKLSANFVSSK